MFGYFHEENREGKWWFNLLPLI